MSRKLSRAAIYAIYPAPALVKKSSGQIQHRLTRLVAIETPAFVFIANKCTSLPNVPDLVLAMLVQMEYQVCHLLEASVDNNLFLAQRSKAALP
jgi:hypothetical protein